MFLLAAYGNVTGLLLHFLYLYRSGCCCLIVGRFPNIYTPQYSIYDVTLSAFKNKKLELFPVVAVDTFLRSSLSVNHE